jgi:hypothetical protein
MSATCFQVPLKLQWIVWTLILLSILILLMPIFCVLLIYKLLAAICVRSVNGTFLDGRDAIWALDADEEASLAIINILAVVSGDLDIDTLRRVVKEKLIPAHPKLKQLRHCSLFGYFFWKEQQVHNARLYQFNCSFTVRAHKRIK